MVGGVLGVGWGGSGVCRWRVEVPFECLSLPYVVLGEGLGVLRGRGGVEGFGGVVVVQHNVGGWFVDFVLGLKRQGVRVVLNVDDWLPSVLGLRGHELFGRVSRRDVDGWRRVLGLVDGVVVSTEFLAFKVRSLVGSGVKVWVCRNGVDSYRYERVRPLVPSVIDSERVLGWAGGIGHRDALLRNRDAVGAAVRDAGGVFRLVGPNGYDGLLRGMVCETDFCRGGDYVFYPEVISGFSVSYAPTMPNLLYRCKSQLRLYESVSAGVPIVGGSLYDEMGLAGLMMDEDDADDVYEKVFRSLTDVEWREVATEAAYMLSDEVSMLNRVSEWEDVMEEVSRL